MYMFNIERYTTDWSLLYTQKVHHYTTHLVNYKLSLAFLYTHSAFTL